MLRTKRNKRGFTLVETISASAILCGSVLTLVAITTRSLTGTRLNRQYDIAASIIDRQLSMLDYIGIDEFAEMGSAEGVVEDFEPGYQWEVTTEYQGIDSLYLVTITVRWTDQKRIHNVSVNTMLNGVSMFINAETEEQE